MPCVKYPDLRLVDQNLVRQLERRADGKAKHTDVSAALPKRGALLLSVLVLPSRRGLLRQPLG